MKIAVGSDHRGFRAKQKVIELLRRLGHEVQDYGVMDEAAADYPDYAVQVAHAVARHEFDRGILICGTGIGMCISANKVHGIRAAPCHDEFTAEMSRRHNDANIMCLSAELLGARPIDRMVEIWLDTEFEGGRHARRVEKIHRIESEQCRPGDAPS
jgi:ribose 5-phosphate isomerase B